MCITSNVHGQSLTGYWKHLDFDRNFISNLRNEILQFDKNTIKRFKFDQRFDQYAFTKIDQEQHRIPKLQAHYSYLGNNRLEITYKAFVEGEKIDFTKTYVKLSPTIFLGDQAHLISEMKRASYRLKINGNEAVLTFGKSLSIDAIPYIDSNTIPGSRLEIENIGPFFFICSYIGDLKQRVHAIPIKQVDTNKIWLYGLPNNLDTITGEKLK